MINAGDGNNTVEGNQNKDVIITGSGIDIIDGGTGNDIINSVLCTILGVVLY